MAKSSHIGSAATVHFYPAMRHSLLLSAVFVRNVFGSLSPDLTALAQKYAPQFRLAPNEKYFPSSVEYMLPHYKIYDKNGQALTSQPSPLNESNIDQVVGAGAGTWLTVSNTTASYLTGTNPSLNNVPVYTFIVSKEGGIVDLFYWIFFPFNLGKDIPALGRVGDHIGDWERMTVRTKNGVAISADYNAHLTGNGAGTYRWNDTLKPSGQDRPLGYIAEGSHGVWPRPGDQVYKNLVVHKLKDKTADGGPTWEAKDNIYPIEYLPQKTYSGNQAWLNFQGVWGNKGQTDCWWYRIVKICKLSDGPQGPYRQDVFTASITSRSLPQSKFSGMEMPLSQTLAQVADNAHTSLYKFRLDSTVSRLIELGSFKYVGVEQTCLDPQPTANTTTVHSAYGFSTLSTNGWRNYSLTVPCCTPESSYVDSYRVGLCTSPEVVACSWAPSRQLRTYRLGQPGVSKGTAIHLDMDDDNWTWN